MCVCVWVLVAQSCPTLCDPMDPTLPGSSVHRILQARIPEWVASSFPLDLPDPGIKPGSPTLQADSLPSEPPEKPCATLLSHRFPHASTDLVQSLPPLFFLFTHLPQIYHPRTSAHTVFSSETWIEHYNWQRPLCLPPSYCRWGNWSFEKGSDFSKTTQWISNRRIQLAESRC